MMTGVDIAGFAVFALAMVGTPGPANMILMTAGARFGLRPALPFVGGIVLGKQLIIWPIGFGLMTLAASVPWLFTALKWGSAAYILWLAWRIAGARIAPGSVDDTAPGLTAGLIVHPLNPKAWAMITAGFTNFVEAGTAPIDATLGIAAVFLAVQCLLHPLWCWGGERLSAFVAGRPAERWIMIGLATATALSVVYVLIKEGAQ
ncbi:MAG: LysE family translocator [Pseudomonadota bacterium]